MDSFTIGLLTNIGMISFVALSAYLMLLVGEVSFGQQAFFGIGAYAAGIATVVWSMPLAAGLAVGALAGAAAQFALALPTLRLRGLYFSIATLSFAEIVRILFEFFRYRREVGGMLVGPDGEHGFRDIRAVFDSGLGSYNFMLVVGALLAAALVGFFLLERSRHGVRLRMIGEDDVIAALNGIPVIGYKLAAACAAGALAGLGGGLYAHSITYIEPGVFNIMLGVHALAYGLIGGLGTALCPLLGVVLDIGFLESFRALAQYRMIIFGGLVALLLIVRPRGLLDEVLVDRIVRLFRPGRHAGA
jgi:branched-chain amino acid transport system permease protein